MSPADPLAESPPPSPQSGASLRRNFTLGVLNGVFFRIADVFFDTQTVLAWFLAQLGASNVLIGLVPPLRFGASFLFQLVAADYVERRPYILPFYRTISIFRCAVLLLLAAAVAWLPVGRTALIVIFLVTLTLFSMGVGLVSLPFMDVVGKVIPPRRRGAFFSQRMFWGGLMALAGSAVVSFLLGEPWGLAFPRNAALLFALSAVFYILTAWSWLLIDEPPSQVVARPQQRTQRLRLAYQLQRGLRLLKHHVPYRRYVLLRLALTFGGWADPFYVVYAQRQLGIPATFIGTYLGVRTLAGLLSNFYWGHLSDHRGNRLLLIATSVVGLTIPGVALLLGALHTVGRGWLTVTSLGWAFGLVFLAGGVFGSASQMGIINYLLDLAPESERPLYLAFTNTLFGLARFAGMASGLVVERFGFTSLLVISGLAYALALLLSLRLVEPRATMNPKAHSAPAFPP